VDSIDLQSGSSFTKQLPIGCFVALWIFHKHLHMETLLSDINIPFTFRQRPTPLAGDLRPAWRMSLVLLMLLLVTAACSPVFKDKTQALVLKPELLSIVLEPPTAAPGEPVTAADFVFSARRRELPLQLAIDAGFSEHGFTEPKRGRCGSGDSFRRRRARFGANYSRAIPGLHRQRGAGFAAKRFPTRRVAGQREDALPRWLSKRDSC